MENRIRFVGIDLDGTMFNSDKQISERNIEVLNEALNAGVTVVPITGRPRDGITGNVFEAAPFPYLVSSGGSAIFDLKTGERLYAASIKKEVSDIIVPGLQDAGFLVNIFLGGKGYVNQADYEAAVSIGESPAWAEYFRKYRNPVPDIIELYRSSGLPMEKITAAVYHKGGMNAEEEAKLLSVLDPYKEDLVIMYGQGMNCEISSPDGTKGSSLAFFEKLLGIPRSEMMVIGDSNNDRDMISKAGVSVVMGNGDEGLKKTADFVTLSNDEDGVAYAIEKLVLNNIHE